VAIRGNRVLINNALRMRDTSSREASDMTDLDPERFTLRQAAQSRDDFAQLVDELEFVKAQLARLLTRIIRRSDPRGAGVRGNCVRLTARTAKAFAIVARLKPIRRRPTR
jgi:hypothetical protein